MKRPRIDSLHRRMFLTAFLTAACTEFVQIFALTIDSLIICNFLTEDDVAAVGLASPFFYLVGIPAVCIAAGLQAVCSREMGRGRIDLVNRTFSQCMLFTFISMAILTAAVFATVPLLASAFGAHGDAEYLLPRTAKYMYGLAYEVIPFVLLSALTPAVILDNGSRTVVVATVAGGLVNIGLDFAAIHYGWGLFGIGLGSSLSAVASLLVLLTNFLRKNRVLRFRFTRIRFAAIREIIRLGAPACVHALAGMLRLIVLYSLAGIYGGENVAVAVVVLAIYGTIMDFVDIPCDGVQGAVGVLAGIGYGERNGEGLERTCILAHRYILAITATVVTALLVFKQPIAGLFLEDGSECFELLFFAIGCIAVSVGLSGLVNARVGYLQATGNDKIARRLEELVNLAAMLVLAVVLPLIFGVHGIFMIHPAARLLTLLLVNLKYQLRTKRFIPHLRDYMRLTPAFYPPEEDRVVETIDSLERCIRVSEAIRRLGEDHGFGRKDSFYASLCTEEITTNVLQHGGWKRHDVRAEFRATVTDGALNMRIRDNGRAFNMNALARILSEEKSPFDNLGIRIICAAATEISYYNLYGMNTTVIRIQPDARPAESAA